jgi:hypothetical protein
MSNLIFSHRCQREHGSRQRMGSEAAKKIYKQRAASAECVNAVARGRGLNKVKAVPLWYALAHNLMRTVTLAQPA